MNSKKVAVNMGEKKIIQEFRLNNIEEIRNYFIKEINQNKLMSKTYKNICTVLNFIEYLLTLASAITGCVSTSAFASLVGIPVEITSSAVELKFCVITAGIKKKKVNS